jgi:hypothetical protein
MQPDRIRNQLHRILAVLSHVSQHQNLRDHTFTNVRRIQAAARGDLDEDLNLTPEMRNLYKRTARRYPYRSHFQWIRAGYGLTGCTLMVLFQGWRTLVPPVATADFVSSYIAVSVTITSSRRHADITQDRHFYRTIYRILFQGPWLFSQKLEGYCYQALGL